MAFPENEKEWNKFLGEYFNWPTGMKRPTIKEYKIANKRFNASLPENRKHRTLAGEMQTIWCYDWLQYFYPEKE